MLARHKGEIPFAVYLLPFITGTYLALHLQLPNLLAWLTGLFFVLLSAFILLNVAYSRFKIYNLPWFGGVLMHVLLLLTGLICALDFDVRNASNYFEKQKADALLIKIDNEPQIKNGYLRFTARVFETVFRGERKTATGKILITLPADTGKSPRLAYGDVLLMHDTVTQVNPPFNPGEFNYKQYLAHQNIYTQAFLYPGQAVLLAHQAGNPIVAYAINLRRKLVDHFKQNIHSAEAAAVASTLILGYKADLSEEITAAYSHTGTIHILSVSGGHVIILFTVIGWMLGFMDSWRYGRFIKSGIIVLLVVYYALLTGLSPAACRAAVMIAVVIVGKAFYRQAHTLNILATSAFFQLLFDPYLLVDVGFQLSYLAVAGLVVFQPIIYKRLNIDNRWLDWLWKFCSASIAAQAITFPLAAYYFHQFPIYFMVSNLLILPLVEAIMYIGFSLLLVAQAGFGSLAGILGSVLKYLILLMNDALRLVEHLPYAYLDKIWLTRLECLQLTVVVVLLFAFQYYRNKRLLGWATIFLLFFSGTFNSHAIEKMQHNGVTFLNLKKHTGVIFKQGERAVLVTDLSDTDKAYRYSIQPGLDSSGIRHLVCCKPNAPLNTSWLIKSGNLMRFAGGDVLIIDSLMPCPRQPVKAKYLYIAQGNFKSVRPLINSHYYPVMIVGAGIAPKNTKAIIRYADSIGEKIFSLRRNYSLVFKSD